MNFYLFQNHFLLDSGVEITSPAVYRNIEKNKLDELLMGDDGVSIPLLQDRVNCLHQVRPYHMRPCGYRGRGVRIRVFPLDPDPAQLKKKIPIRLRIRP